jgi:nicotinamide-nucleotide amidase
MHDPSYLLAEALGNRLNALNLRLALAESCTGGGIAKAITDVPGSSGWFDRDAKIDMLGVKPETLARVGAVSEEAALEMVAGTLTHSLADLALAVTGIAGPDGGTPVKPVGTVFIAWQQRGASGACVKKQFSGDRQSIRQQATLFCLQQLLHMLKDT